MKNFKQISSFVYLRSIFSVIFLAFLFDHTIRDELVCRVGDAESALSRCFCVNHHSDYKQIFRLHA